MTPSQLDFTPWEVKVLSYCENPLGQRVITYKWVWPYSLLPEGNTHREQSRNSASSRAIPTKTMIGRIMNQPYIPDWTANGKGMQGRPMSADERKSLDLRWLQLRDFTIAWTIQTMSDRKARVKAEDIPYMSVEEIAKFLDHDWETVKPHKQDINRPLQPWLFIDWIVSGTSFANLFFQRVHRAAHPGFQRAAYSAAKLWFTTTPTWTDWGDWSLPFVDEDDLSAIESLYVHETEDDVYLDAARVSAARCGRISYLNSGKKDVESDLRWYKDHILTNTEIGEPPHVSPAEHPCMAETGQWGNFIGFRQLRKMIPGEYCAEYTIERLNDYEREMGFELTRAL